MNVTAYLEYLKSLNFKEDDIVCVSFGKSKGEWVGDFFQPFAALGTSETIAKLTKRNEDGQNIFISMAPFLAGTKNRKKEFIAGVRHAFADADVNGMDILEKIYADVAAGIIPDPAVGIESSPGKIQVIWWLNGDFDVAKQEALNRSIQQRYGTDKGVVDTARVLRIPGFINHKYPEKPEARIIARGVLKAYSSTDFKIESAKEEKKTPLSIKGDPVPRGEHDSYLNRLSGKLRHDGMEEEAIYNALIEVVEKRCIDYGSDYLDMCRKHARNICKKPVGKDDTVYVNGVPAGTNPVGVSMTPPQTTVDEPVEQVQEQPLPTFPRLSGILTELSDALYPDIPYEFKVMAAITHWGLIRSGLDRLDNELNLQPRFYTCFIKEPQWGKTAAINEIRNISKVWCARYSAASSIDSGPSLVDEFVDARTIGASADKDGNVIVNLDNPARVLLDPDEMTDLFEKAKVTTQGRNSLFSEMLKLYEGNRTGNRSRKAGKAKVENAYLAILGGATPEGYERMWTGTGGGATGLQSRFTPITTIAPKMPVNRRPSDTHALDGLISRMHTIANQPGVLVTWDPDAKEMLEDWWATTPRDKASESRIEDMVKRLLIVTAVTSGKNRVDTMLMEQAIEWGNYVIAVREKFNPGDAFTWTQAMEDAIRRVGQRHKVAMTQNDYRRLTNVQRKPGGLGPFLSAWKNMVTVSELRAEGTTHKGTIKYKLYS